MLLYVRLFTPLRGRVRPHQGYKVSYVLLVVLLVVVVAPGQIFWTKNIKKTLYLAPFLCL